MCAALERIALIISIMKQPYAVTHTIRQTQFPLYGAVGLQTHLLSKCCVNTKLLVLKLPYKYNTLECFSVETWS